MSSRMAQAVDMLNSTKGLKLKVLTPAESVAAQIWNIEELSMEKTGLFIDNTGEEWST